LPKKKKVEEQLEAILKLLMLLESHLKLIHKDMEKKFMENTITSIEQTRDMIKVNLIELQENAARRKKEESRSFRMLYWSILLSSAIGVLGNLYVSLMFQPRTLWNLVGLLLSGFAIWGVFAFLYLRYAKYRSG